MNGWTENNDFVCVFNVFIFFAILIYSYAADQIIAYDYVALEKI